MDKFYKTHKRVMVNFTKEEWRGIVKGRIKGESDSTLVKRMVFVKQ